jgi:hypothetical protein
MLIKIFEIEIIDGELTKKSLGPGVTGAPPS